MKYLLKLSSPLYLSTIATFLYSSFDQLILIPLVSLTALGVYGVAVSAFTAYYVLISVLGSVLLPVLSGVYGARGSDAFKDSVYSASRYVSIVAMPMAFALVAVARPALTLLGGVRYAEGVAPLTVLTLASVFTIIGMTLGPILIVLNETRLAALCSVLPLALSAGVGLILIPVLGIIGASIARGLSFALTLLLQLYFVRRKTAVKFDSQTLMKSIVASGAMTLAMDALQLSYYSRFLLPIYLSVGLAVYLLAMRALRAITAADMDLIRKMLGPRFTRICDLLTRLIVR